MTWINTVHPDDASGDVKLAYEASLRRYGFVPNLLRSFSLQPRMMKPYMDLSAAVTSSGLKAEELEMIITLVCSLHRFAYGTEAHAEFLRRLTRDAKLAEQIKTDWRQADLEEQHRLLLSFGEKLSRSSEIMNGADIEELRRHGFSDEKILAIVLTVGFYTMASTLGNALGVEVDAQFVPGTPEYNQFLSFSPSTLSRDPAG
jgi:uncharacterized peroxidase-related enzyme